MRKVANKDETDIAYQNKDIVSKVLAEKFKGKSFNVYGIDLPKIVDVGPTNLPEISASELRMDNLFRLEDDSIAIVDYESKYDEANIIKYLGYIARVSKKLYNEHKKLIPLRLIVIYTADVTKDETKPHIDMGAYSVNITEGFLIEIDSEAVRDGIVRKLDAGEALSDEDIMNLIIYPLTHKGNEAKQEALSEAIDMAERIEDEQTLIFTLSTMLVFADKVISKEDASRIKERLNMHSKVLQLFEEEKQQDIKEAVNKAVSKAVNESRREEQRKTVLNFLREGVSEEIIARATGMSIDKITKIKESTVRHA